MAASIVPLAGGQTIVYSPEEAIRAIQELSQAVEEMSRRIQVLENLLLFTRHVLPEKPRSPMLVYADGVNWNPGSGEGYYEFRIGGTWHKL